MKILNVSYTLDAVHGGGVAERSFQMSRALAAAGQQVSLLTLDRGIDGQRRQQLSGVELVALPCRNRRFYLPRGGRAEIGRLVAEADVIHLMGHWNILNVLAARAARKFQRPYVVCPAGELQIFGRSRLLKNCFNRIVGRRIVTDAAAWIAVTGQETGQFAPYGVTPDTVTVIPNGIDPADFAAADGAEFRREHGLSSQPLVLFMGRLNPIKGPDLLLEAFLAVRRKFPECQLAFAGPDGGMLNGLRELAASTAAPASISVPGSTPATPANGRIAEAGRIHFLGWIGGDDRSRAYHAADLLVIPSRQEAMSIVVLEAGICGTPVLLTDQCGFDDVEQAGGGLVVPATSAGLEAGLSRLLAAPDQLPGMGRQLQRFVQSRFCWGSIVQRYLDLYGPLVRKAG